MIALLLLSVSLPMSLAADSPFSSQVRSSITNIGGVPVNQVSRKYKDFGIHQGSSNNDMVTELRGGGAVASKTKQRPTVATTPVAVERFGWFKPGMTVRAKWLGF